MDEPAFPSTDYISGETVKGMTLRDYFAAKAMQSMIINVGMCTIDGEFLAKGSYVLANAMLKERSERGEK